MDTHAVCSQLFDLALGSFSRMLTSYQGFSNGDSESRRNTLSRATAKEPLGELSVIIEPGRVLLKGFVDWQYSASRYLTSDDYRGNEEHRSIGEVRIVASSVPLTEWANRSQEGDHVFGGQATFGTTADGSPRCTLRWEKLAGMYFADPESVNIGNSELATFLSSYTYLLADTWQ